MLTIALMLLALLSIMLGTIGCVRPPKLTAESRKSDMEYLARWARDCHPLVELNEQLKGAPSYGIISSPRFWMSL